MNLLKQLYSIHSHSGQEQEITQYIIDWVSKNVADASCEVDSVGNVYITKGDSDTYPVLAAHLDQVQRHREQDFQVVETDDILFGYSPSEREFQGIGGDDKNGIWIALKCLTQYDVLKAVFFVGEEIGCVGSSKCDMAFFADARFVVECDRRGNNDLITSISGLDIASRKFIDDIQPALFEYKESSGLMTDVLELAERGVGVACINISCGYYSPHTEQEYTVKEDIVNALALVMHIIENCTEVYKHQVEKRYIYRHAGYTGYNSYHGKWSHSYDDDWDYGYDVVDSDVATEPELHLWDYSDFSDIDSYIDQLVFANCEEFFPEDLWEYVKQEIQGFIDEADFIARAYVYWNRYSPYGDMIDEPSVVDAEDNWPYSLQDCEEEEEQEEYNNMIL